MVRTSASYPQPLDQRPPPLAVAHSSDTSIDDTTEKMRDAKHDKKHQDERSSKSSLKKILPPTDKDCVMAGEWLAHFCQPFMRDVIIYLSISQVTFISAWHEMGVGSVVISRWLGTLCTFSPGLHQNTPQLKCGYHHHMICLMLERRPMRNTHSNSWKNPECHCISR